MYSLEDWIRHGNELRRPLLVNQALAESNRVVIVGGGLSGLSLAYRIGTERPDIFVTLIEKTTRLGGVIETWKRGGWICDVSVNAARPHPAFWRLVHDLGIDDEFKQSNENARSRWIMIGERKHRISMFTAAKIGPLGILKGYLNSKVPGKSVFDVIQNGPISDALTLGILNDSAKEVDANFLFPSFTGFGPKPPVRKRRLRNMISASYPIFTPKRGSLASLDSGMYSIIEALESRLNQMKNIEIVLESKAENPDEVSKSQNVPLSSIIWSTGMPTGPHGETEISVFAAGYESSDVNHIGVGYGTLIPNIETPVSGILHESDIHSSQRAPNGHRLFRLMVPHQRWGGNEGEVVESVGRLLKTVERPALFEKIGTRRIPRFPPGYMKSIAEKKYDFSVAGWTGSGVSVTHVVDEAERISELFRQGPKP